MYKYLTIQFPESGVQPIRANSFRLIQNNYEHELAYITFNDWNMDLSDIQPGLPVTIELHNLTKTRYFVGYVHHLEPKKTPGTATTTMAVMGASYVMKQSFQKVYKNTTASEVVKQIAERNKFAYYVVDHPRVYPQIVQSGHSDWELIAHLAKQCGYMFIVENTELYFQPLTEDFTNKRSEAPKFVQRNRGNPKGSTLYSFNPLIGESLSFNGVKKAATAISGYDYITKQGVFSITNQNGVANTRVNAQHPHFDHFATMTTATDPISAAHEADSAEELTRFPYRASAVVLGDPSLRPGMPVFLDGLGLDYSGYWIVLSAEHEVENRIYTTKLEVGIDALGSATTWSGGTLRTQINLVKPISSASTSSFYTNGFAGDRMTSDSSYVSAPSPKSARTVHPLAKTTKVKSKSVITVSKKAPKAKSNIEVTKVNNRAPKNTINKHVTNLSWTNTHKNIKNPAPVAPKSRSAVVTQRLRRAGHL
jgi:hypothetical protein